MTLDQAIARVTTKATRMEILARVERGGPVADGLARDAEAMRVLVACVRGVTPVKEFSE